MSTVTIIDSNESNDRRSQLFSFPSQNILRQVMDKRAAGPRGGCFGYGCLFYFWAAGRHNRPRVHESEESSSTSKRASESPSPVTGTTSCGNQKPDNVSCETFSGSISSSPVESSPGALRPKEAKGARVSWQQISPSNDGCIIDAHSGSSPIADSGSNPITEPDGVLVYFASFKSLPQLSDCVVNEDEAVPPRRNPSRSYSAYSLCLSADRSDGSVTLGQSVPNESVAENAPCGTLVDKPRRNLIEVSEAMRRFSLELAKPVSDPISDALRKAAPTYPRVGRTRSSETGRPDSLRRSQTMKTMDSTTVDRIASSRAVMLVGDLERRNRKSSAYERRAALNRAWVSDNSICLFPESTLNNEACML